MKRIVAICLLLVAGQAFGEFYKATTRGQSLLFAIPDGWRRATSAEMLGLSAGLNLYGDSDDTSIFSALVLPSATPESSAYRGVLNIAYTDGLSDQVATKELLQAYGDILKDGMKCVSENDGADNQFFSTKIDLEEFETHAEWAGLWMTQNNTAKRDVFKNAPKHMYSFIGGIMIDERIYVVRALSTMAISRPEKNAFKDFVYTWMRDMVVLNKGGAASRVADVQRNDNPKRTDQKRAGDVVSWLPATITEQDISTLLEGEQKKFVRANALVAGLSVEFVCAKAFEMKEQCERYQLFYAGYVSESFKAYISIDIGLEKVCDGADLIINAINAVGVTDKDYYNLFASTSKRDKELLGAGTREIGGRKCLWYTALMRGVPLRTKKFSYIERGYAMLLPGKSMLLNFTFRVANTSSEQPPVADFEKAYPVIDTFLKSVTVTGVKDDVAIPADPVTDFPAYSGTGWYVNSNHIVTCWHVVRNAANPTFVTEDGTEVKLELVAKDELHDIVVMKVLDRHFKCDAPLVLAKNEDASVAETVFTVGYPKPELMGKEPKYTIGVISSLSGVMGDKSQYQISTPVQPGNSGGALIDEGGKVVGVVQSRLESGLSSDETDSRPQNVNYAIKIRHLTKLLKATDIGYFCEMPKKNPTPKEAYAMARAATVFILVR